MCVPSISAHTKKKSGNLSYAPRIYIYIYIYREREREKLDNHVPKQDTAHVVK